MKEHRPEQKASAWEMVVWFFFWGGGGREGRREGRMEGGEVGGYIFVTANKISQLGGFFGVLVYKVRFILFFGGF